MLKQVETPWTHTITQLQDQLVVNPLKGLSTSEIIKRTATFGKNNLKLTKPVSIISIFIQQLKSVIVLLLLVAAIISFTLQQNIEGSSIIAVLVINTLIGFFTEHKAIRSMEALRKMGKTTTTVLRDQSYKIIDADELTIGDIIILEAGDIVSADARIIEASRLFVDESTLTGESLPVEKISDPIAIDVPLSERSNMLFRGTFLTNGSVKAIVTAIGMTTEVGKIARITEQAHKELTPLEERLDQLGKKLVWFSLAIALLIGGAGLIAGKDLYLMLETAVALAVATIPEGLPIVATLALAKGMLLLSKKNVLVNKLSAVETLGATSIILTDKTGTLTENKMTVRTIATLDRIIQLNSSSVEKNEFLIDCLKLITLCNNASFDHSAQTTSTGDPMEVALLIAAAKYGIEREQLLTQLPELKEDAFNSQTRMMATMHQDGPNILYAIKGAPENIIQQASYIQLNGELIPLEDQFRQSLYDLNHSLASDGQRVLAVAKKHEASVNCSPYTHLIFCGLIGLIDPARTDIKDSLKKCSQAGIKVIMATGDQAHTAIKIAKDIELDALNNFQVITGSQLEQYKQWPSDFKDQIKQATIFCRVTPEHKLKLVKFFQDEDFVVAMTGDGVNDAPALKKADIGIAMGIRGTQVAKDAADMVLQDDHFVSIVLAIKQGRIIFSNIQKFVIYLLSCNLSEVLVITFATVINAPLPLLPLQILFLNLVTDVFPALALGMGAGDNSYLKRAPRKKNESIITIENWRIIIFYSILITLSVLGAFFTFLNADNSNVKLAVTVSFMTLGLAQVFHVFNMRLTNSNIFINDITKNPYVWGATFLCLILLLLSIQIPFFQMLLNLQSLQLDEWLTVLFFSLLPLIIGNTAISLGIGIKR